MVEHSGLSSNCWRRPLIVSFLGTLLNLPVLLKWQYTPDYLVGRLTNCCQQPHHHNHNHNHTLGSGSSSHLIGISSQGLLGFGMDQWQPNICISFKSLVVFKFLLVLYVYICVSICIYTCICICICMGPSHPHIVTITITLRRATNYWKWPPNRVGSAPTCFTWGRASQALHSQLHTKCTQPTHKFHSKCTQIAQKYTTHWGQLHSHYTQIANVVQTHFSLKINSPKVFKSKCTK